MALIINEEQQMLKQSAKDFLKERSPVEALRKLRDTNDANGYDKDLWQLAIESEMLRRKGLDYQPKCISVCIDITTKKHHHKVWSEDQVKEAIEIMKLISRLYWKIRM